MGFLRFSFIFTSNTYELVTFGVLDFRHCAFGFEFVWQNLTRGSIFAAEHKELSEFKFDNQQYISGLITCRCLSAPNTFENVYVCDFSLVFHSYHICACVE